MSGSGMHHHGSCNGHDGTDALFRNGIMMMSSNTGKLGNLMIVGQVFSEVFGGKGRPIVRHMCFRDNTIVTTDFLKQVFGSQGIMRRKGGLEFDMGVVGTMVN